jgi:hypothetical protein
MTEPQVARRPARFARRTEERTVVLECRLCGVRYTAKLPWQGRPQGYRAED